MDELNSAVVAACQPQRPALRSGVRRQVDLTLLASISWRLFFVYVAVSETLQQLRYEQQWFSALIQWERPSLPWSGEESGECASYATWHQSAAEYVSS